MMKLLVTLCMLLAAGASAFAGIDQPLNELSGDGRGSVLGLLISASGVIVGFAGNSKRSNSAAGSAGENTGLLMIIVGVVLFFFGVFIDMP